MNEQGNNKDILFNSVSSGGSNNGATFLDEFILNKDVGEISSEKLFSEEDISSTKENLYYSLNYISK